MKKILNILLIVLLAITVVLCAWAIIVTPPTSNNPTPAECSVLATTLTWGYILLVGAIVAALFCAAWGMLKNPSGIKSTILSVVVIIVVVVASYLLAKGSPAQIPDLEHGGYFGEGEALLSSASIWVAYFGMAGAILAALWSEITGAFK
ncbi:MAG: hypothetical protein J1D86_06440 [Alistipes sp.]|nr:hypothetical protein [Alistipes sp.]